MALALSVDESVPTVPECKEYTGQQSLENNQEHEVPTLPLGLKVVYRLDKQGDVYTSLLLTEGRVDPDFLENLFKPFRPSLEIGNLFQSQLHFKNN